MDRSESATSEGDIPPTRKSTRESRRMALLKRTGLFGGDTRGAVVSRAVSVEDLLCAYGLVHDAFVEKGFIRPHPSGTRMRVFEALGSTATFVAKANGGVVGVGSLVADSEDLGLPSDEAFGDEIDALRRQGRRVCEATNEAVATDFRKTAVPTELMRCLYAHASSVGCADLITTVSPGHARFYGLLGFERISEVRSYSREIHDPVVVVRMNFDTIQPRAEKVDQNELADDCFLKSYYLDDNSYHRYVKTWSILAERTFADPQLLQELFVVRSPLLAECSQRELDAVRRRWGQDVFAAVWQAPHRVAPGH